MIIHFTVRHMRFGNEVFTSTKLENKAAFQQIVNALVAKGFKVDCKEYEYIGEIALVVSALKSDKAVQYAVDVARRAGQKAGFAFLSTQHK